MDKRKNNKGTIGNKGGRPPKADEVALIEKLTPLDEIAYKALEQGVREGNFPFIKLFMEYRFGKPKETIDQHTTGETVVKVVRE